MSTLVSIVIPARNEQDNIGPLERELGESLAGLPYDFEFIVIDNGSTDGTQAAVKATVRQGPALEVHPVQPGLRRRGIADRGLQDGVRRGDRRPVLGPPGSAPGHPGFLEKWREGYDVVYGVRTVRPGDAKWRNGMVKIVYS